MHSLTWLFSLCLLICPSLYNLQWVPSCSVIFFCSDLTFPLVSRRQVPVTYSHSCYVLTPSAVPPHIPFPSLTLVMLLSHFSSILDSSWCQAPPPSQNKFSEQILLPSMWCMQYGTNSYLCILPQLPSSWLSAPWYPWVICKPSFLLCDPLHSRCPPPPAPPVLWI